MKIIMLPSLMLAFASLILPVSVMANTSGEISPHKQDLSLRDYLPESCYQTGLYSQQKSLAGINKVLETQGSFAFACDKGLLWHSTQPLQETVVYQLQGGTHLIGANGKSQKLTGTVQRHLGQMLNNLLGGNSAYLEKTFFIAATETGIQLTPRNKRMEKFLRSIHITRADEAVMIRMQHQGDEFTAIRVYALQSQPSLNTTQCQQVLPAENSVAVACKQLLAP